MQLVAKKRVEKFSKLLAEFAARTLVQFAAEALLHEVVPDFCGFNIL